MNSLQTELQQTASMSAARNISVVIPDAWKSPRQRIIETYVEGHSVREISVMLGYDSPSFVRMVIHDYREFIKMQNFG